MTPVLLAGAVVGTVATAVFAVAAWRKRDAYDSVWALPFAFALMGLWVAVYCVARLAAVGR